MSYQVLARKWRPRIFREMVGQEHVLQALINALDHNRLHHAYLFTGTRGVGKTTIARILAKCLNCETGVSSEPCGTCSACTEINQGRFVDLIEVDAASRTRVEDTRELLDNVQYAPTRGRYKIYLIDEVHMLSNSSFNALLKTLEEPPEHVKFLLATTDPQKLPVTILSRCLQFNLKNMMPEPIVAHLKQVLAQEMVPFEEAALWQLARSADGSMRDALSLTDQAIGFGNGKIADADVSIMLGTIDHKFIEQLMAALAAADAAAVLDAVAQFSEQAPNFHAALGDLIGLLHRVAIAQVIPEAIDNSLGDKEPVLRFASALASEDVQLFYQMALTGRRDLHLSPEPRGGFEMTLLRMLAFKPQGVATVPTQALPQAPGASQGVHAVQQEGQAPAKKRLATAPNGADVAPGGEVGGGAIEADAINSVAIQSPATKTAVSKPLAEAPPPLAWDNSDAAPKKQLVQAEVSRASGKSFAANQSGSEPAAQPIHPQVSAAPPVNTETAQIKNTTEEAAPRLANTGVGKEPYSKSLESTAPSDWIDLYHELNIRGVLQSTAANCILVGLEGNQLHFWLDETKGSLFDDSHIQRLNDVITDFFKQPVKVFVQLKPLPEGAETPALYQARRLGELQSESLHLLDKSPVVQFLKGEFGAVIDETTVRFDKSRIH